MSTPARKAITRIDHDSVLRICANQVVTDLATAIKELVENALDAGATTIDVRIRQHGLGGIEVADNGSGIDPADYATLATKSATSKLRNFEDLDHVTAASFGFRGEALASLCALGNVSVVTCTAAQGPRGAKLTYDTAGALTSQQPVAARQGTAVTVTNLFEAVPVRHAEFMRNAKREYAKALAMLHQYAVACTLARITLAHVTTKGASESKQIVFATKPAVPDRPKSLTDNLASIAGGAVCKHLQPVAFESTATSVAITGVLTLGPGRSGTDFQFIFLNGRPVDLPKLSRAINAGYRELYPSGNPIFALNLTVMPGDFDVNVTPDKRTVMLVNEAKVLEEFRTYLQEFYAPTSTTFDAPPLAQSTLWGSQPLERASSTPAAPTAVSSLTPSQQPALRSASFSGAAASRDPAPTSTSLRLKRRINALTGTPPSTPPPRKQVRIDSNSDVTDPASPALDATPTPICDHADGTCTCASLPDESTFPVDDRTRQIHKADFSAMQILGQFNLGFILVRHGPWDLYIVDQHAADEKYNYERYLREPPTVQPLVRPVDLRSRLSASEVELVAQVRESVVRRAGFAVDDEMKLTAVPTVRQGVQGDGVPLGVGELVTVVHRAAEGGDETGVAACEKVRAMCASRACRSSIMIGMPLERTRMVKVVRNLATMEHPWNCPHGRPTMRFLFDMRDLATIPAFDGCLGDEDGVDDVAEGAAVVEPQRRVVRPSLRLQWKGTLFSGVRQDE
ncbi:DNA mismatch repair protein MutL [Allomyces macrogynus ATCC 38327]|uniref:DNA mismatch repair protein MutL n=1 Tax=Allomyces macrogynus (strain ATCC 38327) TaxID=578462 RepID=A0A0L0T2Q6_ALLM3|nr:DNA mismatch repair protein MutL [Allomyces macrogynus ATCC 38327]|eukprot:KNE69016.1 DNA mismatch repair protein MutL [Allomyces macrogynus ATCC 38327]